MNKTLIQFLRPWTIYAPGDCVAFDETRAQPLIDRGIAQRRPSSVPSGQTTSRGPQDESPPKELEKTVDSNRKTPSHKSAARSSEAAP